jgi:hypothetical protein
MQQSPGIVAGIIDGLLPRREGTVLGAGFYLVIRVLLITNKR